MMQLTTRPVGYNTWTDHFPRVSRESDSLTFVKCLTNLTIPTILYNRKILPSSEFENKLFEGMTLKALKKNGNSETRRIETWLAGAMDALERKYLKDMILEIKDGQTELNLETYTISVGFTQENPSKDSKQIVMRNSKEELSAIQQATVKFLQTCYTITESFVPLPSQILISMKLSYHENTPLNYQPSGYKDYLPITPAFIKKTTNIGIGVINTNHVFLELANTTCFSNENLLPKIMRKGNICEVIREAPSDLVTEELRHREQKLNLEEAQLSQQSSQTSRSDISSCFQISECGSLSDQIRCPCLSRIKTSSMYQCSGCGYWVHAECFGVRPGTTVKLFYCQICHKLNKDFICHDKDMTSLNRHSDQQKLAVLRRLMGFCSRIQEDKVSFKKFEKVSGLACHQTFLQIVLKEMVELGMLNRLPGNIYSVNLNNIKWKLREYFYEEISVDVKFSAGIKKESISEQMTQELCKRKLLGTAEHVKKVKRTTSQNIKKLAGKKNSHNVEKLISK